MMQKVQEETQNMTADMSVSESIDTELSVPKWPKYDTPNLQKKEINQELKEVTEEASKWKSLYEKSTKEEDQKNFKGLSDF